MRTSVYPTKSTALTFPNMPPPRQVVLNPRSVHGFYQRDPVEGAGAVNQRSLTLTGKATKQCTSTRRQSACRNLRWYTTIVKRPMFTSHQDGAGTIVLVAVHDVCAIHLIVPSLFQYGRPNKSRGVLPNDPERPFDTVTSCLFPCRPAPSRASSRVQRFKSNSLIVSIPGFTIQEC